MKRLLVLGAIGVLFAAFAPASHAAAKYSSSKSNDGNFVLSYDPNIVTQAQAAAILTDLEKPDQPIDEPGVRDVLREEGVQNDSIKKVVIEPGPNGSKGATILLLAKPADETAARSAI